MKHLVCLIALSSLSGILTPNCFKHIQSCAFLVDSDFGFEIIMFIKTHGVLFYFLGESNIN